MKYTATSILALATTVLGAHLGNGTSSSVMVELTTVTLTAITTFCPEATEVTQNGVTYTATASETLTITDCPCTLTVPITSTVTFEDDCDAATTPAIPYATRVAPTTEADCTPLVTAAYESGASGPSTPAVAGASNVVAGASNPAVAGNENNTSCVGPACQDMIHGAAGRSGVVALGGVFAVVGVVGGVML